MMSSIDQTIVATALHSMQHSLHASIVMAGWTITAYSFGQILMLPVAGRLCDKYGKRNVFIASVTIFSAASLCCGLASNIYLLVALRAIQAIGGAGFTPSATGIVVDHFGDGRDRAVGMFGSIFPIGTIIGPILGGFFVVHLSWRAIFLVNVPIGIVLLLLCLRYVPRDTGVRVTPGQRLDVVGMVLLGTGIGTAMVGLSYLGTGNSHAAAVQLLLSLAISLLAIGMFIRHVRRASDPFIPAHLIFGRGFGVTNTINFLYGGAASGLGALVPLYAVERYGIGTIDSGTLLSARGIAVIALSALAVLALRRTGYRSPILIGLLLSGGGTLALGIAPIGATPYVWLAVAAAVTGVGIGWSSPATRNASLQLVPSQAAVIASLRSTCRQAGSITAVSVTTAILAQADDRGSAFGYIFIGFGLLLFAAMPLVFRIPEHRGMW